MFELAVSENIKRRDLNPVEQASAMKRYMTDFGKTSQEAGEFFNVNAATVRGTVRLLELPEAARQRLASGEITIGAARKLLILARVAPETIEHSVERIVDGDLPDKVIEGALDEIAFHNKAIKMWSSWLNGKPLAGPGLWELDTPTKKFDKYMPPITGPDGFDRHLAKKILASDGLVAHRDQLEDWARKLQSGLFAPDALIAGGAPADTIEHLDQLIYPPVCTACPFYVKVLNNHYCTWKVCHTRKKEAWGYVEEENIENNLGIKIMTTDEARGGFVPLNIGWNEAQKALVEGKDPNLRLHIKPQQYEHAYTGSEIVEVVTIAPKAVAAQDEEKRKEKSTVGSKTSAEEYRAQQDREHKLRTASGIFVITEAEPIFATLLEGIDNLGFLMALADITDFDHTGPGKKPITRKDKLQFCRINIISDMLDVQIGYQDEINGPVCVAEFLSGLATTWGVDLPADWLEKAASYWPEDVPIQVVTNKKEFESA
jgi:hypothetical protein